MPPTAVNENHGTASRKYHIGATGQVFGVESVAIPAPVQGATDGAFRGGIRRAHPAHDLAAVH